MAFLCDEQPMDREPLAEDESREDADGSGADGLVVGAAVEARLAALVEKQVAAALLRERQDAKATNEASKTSEAEEWVKARGTVYSLFIAGSDDSEQRGVPAFILFVQFVTSPDQLLSSIRCSMLFLCCVRLLFLPAGWVAVESSKK